MDPAAYLRAIRRHWIIVVSAVVIALLVAWPLARTPRGSQNQLYEATAYLLNTDPSATTGSGGARGPDGATGGTWSLNTLATLTKLGEVPVRVAEELGFEGDVATLTGEIQAVVDEEGGTLNITATSRDRGRAELLANTFADELLAFLTERDAEFLAGEIGAQRAVLRRLNRDIAPLEAELEKATEEQNEDARGQDTRNLEAELDQLKDERAEAQVQLGQLLAQEPGPAGMEVIERAAATPVDEFALSRRAQIFVAGLLGLLAGVALALVRDRFDTRIRTKGAAEEHFSAPVLAQIPGIPRRERGAIVATAERGSLSSEAFRLLGSTVSREVSANGSVGASRDGQTGATTILVTSAGPSEGKTTVVANLAATFAERGNRVLVMSCDFHRPQIHKLFGVPNRRGLAEALQEEPDGHLLEEHMWATPLGDVRLVPSGPRPKRPSQLLASERMRHVVREARGEADIVLIDTAPILTASDVTYLLPESDAVLVVARAGKTTAQQAERTSELLTRLGAHVVGVALNRSRDVAVSRYAYRYYVHKEGSE